MFKLITVSAHGPCTGGGKYRRPVHIRIFNPDIQPTEYARQGKGRSVIVQAEWKNVDSRFQGPRSAYGQSLAMARSVLARLNGTAQEGGSL